MSSWLAWPPHAFNTKVWFLLWHPLPVQTRGLLNGALDSWKKGIIGVHALLQTIIEWVWFRFGTTYAAPSLHMDILYNNVVHIHILVQSHIMHVSYRHIQVILTLITLSGSHQISAKLTIWPHHIFVLAGPLTIERNSLTHNENAHAYRIR